MSTRRRTFLAGGLAAAAVGLAGGGALFAIQPRRGWLVPPDGGPARVEGAPRVVVVGGGLAGISAAIELAARGCRVTLVEQGNALGGKLTGWTIDALGEQFPVEHGFHGFFSQYYNLLEMFAAAGVRDDDFVQQTSYPVLFPTGEPERFTNTTPVWPLNLAAVIVGSERLQPMEFRDADGLLDLMRYRGAATYDAYDDVDFATWIAARRVPKSMVDVVLRPFGDATLNRIEKLSAAEAIRFFHFYFLGNPEGLAFRALRRDVATAVLTPLRAHLEALGVEIRLSTAASRVIRDGNEVVAVDLAGPAPGAPTTTTIPSAAVGEAFTAIDVGGPAFVARRHGGVIALDARCTHQGCPIARDGAGFRCPCHGGRFDAAGAPTAGPPTRALAALSVSEADGVVTVTRRDTSVRLDCDACVLACDVRGLRPIIAASDLDAGLAARVASLGESEPYAVVRFWLDAPVNSERSAFYTTTGFRYTDSLAVYSAFQEPFIDWARRTGGCVIETHAYAIAADDVQEQDSLVEAMLVELRAMLPELASARVLHVVAQLQSNFTRWAPGDAATRPGVETPHPNLFLAGDHTRIDAPVALMEAAVVSGRLAANGILRRSGAGVVPIPRVAAEGVLAWQEDGPAR